MSVGFDPVDPAVNVGGFFESVGRQFAAAIAVRPSIGEKNHVVILDQPHAVSVCSHAIVGNAVKKDDRISIRLGGAQKPCSESGAVLRDNLGIAKFNSLLLGRCSRIAFLSRGDAVTIGMKRDPTEPDATQDRASDIQGG